MSAPPVTIEVLDRRGHIVQRLRAERWPVRIGRGYDNDVRLDDAYVAAHHVELRWDEERAAVAMMAMASQNPPHPSTSPAKPVPHGQAMELAEGVHLWTVGRTPLRIVVGTPPVPAERPLYSNIDGRDKRWALLLLIGAILISAWETWFAMTDPVKTGEIAKSAMAAAALLVAWAGLWSFITRLLQGTTALWAHLRLAAGAAVIGALLVWTIDLASFSFNWPALSRWRAFVFGALLVGLLLAHLRWVNHGHRPRVVMVVLAAAAGAALVSFIQNYQTHKTIAPGSFLSHVAPPSWRVAGERSTEDFFAQAQDLKAQVDALQAIDAEEEGFLE